METATFKTPAGEQIKKALAFCEKGIAGAEMYTFLRLNEPNLPEGRFFCAENNAGEIVSAVFMNGDITVTKQAGQPPCPGLCLMVYAGAVPDAVPAAPLTLADTLAFYKAQENGVLTAANETRYVYRARAMRDGFAAGFGTKENGRCVGFAYITAANTDSGLIGDVFTLPEARGRGFAKQNVLACVRWCADRGKRAYLLCEPRMAPFYAGFGFRHCTPEGEIRGNTDENL